MNKLKSILLTISIAFTVIIAIGAVANNAEAAELASTHAYYDALDANEKVVYTQLVKEMKKVNKNYIPFEKELREVEGDETQQGIMDVLDAIYHEHPEIYWFGSINDGSVGYTLATEATYYDEKGNKLPFEYEEGGKKKKGYEHPDYSYTIASGVKLFYNEYADSKTACDQELELLYNNAIKGVTSSMSDAKKIMTVHDNLCKSIYYDYEGRDHKKGDEAYPIVDNTVYGTLKNGKAVCSGYARTFQYILHRLGIECYCVVGDAMHYSAKKGEMEFQEAHEWNVVKIGSQYLNVDLTWGDRYRESSRDADKEQASYISYSYFAVADSQICVKHRNAAGTSTIMKEKFSDSHVRHKVFENAVPYAKTALSSFKNTFGLERKDAFIKNFDEQYAAVVTSVDEYFKQVHEAFKNGSYYNTVQDKILETGYVSDTETVNTRSLVSQSRYILIIGAGSTGEGLDVDIASEFDNTGQGSRMRNEWTSIRDEMKLIGTVYKTVRQGNDKVEYRTCQYQSVDEGLLWTDIDCAYWTISQAITYIDKDCMPSSINANMRGDVNGDKIVDSKDAVQLLMSISFPKTYSVTQSADTTAKDMNGDGKITVDDALYLLMNTKFPTDKNYVLSNKITIKTE